MKVKFLKYVKNPTYGGGGGGAQDHELAGISHFIRNEQGTGSQ